MSDNFTEDDLRRTLVEWIVEEFSVDEMYELDPETDSDGKLIAVSESIRRKYRSRLEGLRRVAPSRIQLQAQCRSVLRVLEECANDEVFYYWEAHSEQWNYAGVTTPKRVIEFLFHRRDHERP